MVETNQPPQEVFYYQLNVTPCLIAVFQFL